MTIGSAAKGRAATDAGSHESPREAGEATDRACLEVVTRSILRLEPCDPVYKDSARKLVGREGRDGFPLVTSSLHRKGREAAHRGEALGNFVDSRSDDSDDPGGAGCCDPEHHLRSLQRSQESDLGSIPIDVDPNRPGEDQEQPHRDSCGHGRDHRMVGKRAVTVWDVSTLL